MTRDDRGFGLLELLVVIALMGIIVAPLSAFVVTTLRAATMASYRASAAAAVTTSANLVGTGRLGDACEDPGSYGEVLVGRLGLGENWSVDVVAECSTEWPALVTVTLEDPRGFVTSVTAVEGGLS